jgi:hypothetical protein
MAKFRQSGSLPQRLANVGRGFSQKVVDKLMVHWNLLGPIERKKMAKYLPGSRHLEFFDKLALLALREQNPQRTLENYKTNLMQNNNLLVPWCQHQQSAIG